MYQQDFSKPFPRLSCPPEPPIHSEEGPGCLANMARIFLALSSGQFQKQTCLMKASSLAHRSRAGVLKQFLIFMAPGPRPDVTPEVQSPLIGNERRLIDWAAPLPAHVAVTRWRVGACCSHVRVCATTPAAESSTAPPLRWPGHTRQGWVGGMLPGQMQLVGGLCSPSPAWFLSAPVSPAGRTGR